MPFLEPFQEARKAKNLSLPTVSMLSNTPVATVTRLFNGKTPNPTIDTLVPVANVLEVSLDEIFGLKEPGQKPLDPNVEAMIASYTELLKEKEERIKEKDAVLLEKEQLIEDLKVEKVKAQKEKGKILSFALLFASVVIFILLFDMMNGHFGYFRY